MECTSVCCCGNRDAAEINAVITKLENALQYNSVLYGRWLKWGYNSPDRFLQEKRAELWLRTLRRHYRNLVLERDVTLKCADLNRMMKQINDYINLSECGKVISTVKIDETGEAAWIALNPTCVSMEKWEKCVYSTFPALQLTVTKEAAHTILYDLIRTDVFCDVVYDLQKKEYNEDNCRIEYDLLKTETNCSLTYDMFRQAQECGLTYDTIRKAIDCSLTFDTDRDDIMCVLRADGSLLKFTDLEGVDLSCLENN